MGLSKELKDNLAEGAVPTPEEPETHPLTVDPLPIDPLPIVDPLPIDPLPVEPPAAVIPETPEPVADEDARALLALMTHLGNRLDALDTVVESLDGVHATLERLEERLTALETGGGADLPEQLALLQAQMTAVTEKQDRNDRQLVQELRENATFRIQVRQSMQSELDDLREQQRGEQFNPLLKELAALYADYYFLLSGDLSPVTRKNLGAMFDQLSDLLEDYGVEVIITPEGQPRQNRLCKVASTIPVGDESLHNTIAHSRKPGLVRDRLVLCQEFADVYVYDPTLAPAEPAADPEPAAEPDEQPEQPAEQSAEPVDAPADEQ